MESLRNISFSILNMIICSDFFASSFFMLESILMCIVALIVSDDLFLNVKVWDIFIIYLNTKFKLLGV